MTNQCEHGSLARTCPLCEANAEIAALRAEVERLRAMPMTESAAAMGAIGAEAAGVAHHEGERLAFEAWVHGHCWELCAEWKDGGYSANDESSNFVNPAATETRRMWAAWRDRGALAEAVISALRDEAARLRGHLQDSVRAQTSGRQLTVIEIDGWWEISIPITIERITVIPHWPCEAKILSSYVPPGTPTWFVPNAMNLAKLWRAAFGEGGAA